MPEDNCQKIKLLKIMEILRKDSDARHPITTNAFCKLLISMGITCDRRTLSRDMALLNEYGYKVYSCMRGHEKGYYVEDEGFSISELKLMMDAVQAANFVPDEMTEKLVDKIAALANHQKDELLRQNMVCFNTRKHGNYEVYDNIRLIEEALDTNCRISFLYFDLDADGKRVYRKEGKRFNVIPCAMVYHEDHYYLMTYNVHFSNTNNFRIDRMDEVKVEKERPFEGETVEPLRKVNYAEYTKEVFRMYGGAPSNVVLQFDPSVLGAVYDRFGEKLKVKELPDGWCETRVHLQVSPAFFGWVFQFGDKMRIVGPNRIAERYSALAAQTCTLKDGEEITDEEESN